ncbi:mCG147735 [Mus musculus]|nr:mCG147735 [Mus musculus]
MLQPYTGISKSCGQTETRKFTKQHLLPISSLFLSFLSTFITVMVRSLHASEELTTGVITTRKPYRHSPMSDTVCVRTCL